MIVKIQWAHSIAPFTYIYQLVCYHRPKPLYGTNLFNLYKSELKHDTPCVHVSPLDARHTTHNIRTLTLLHPATSIGLLSPNTKEEIRHGRLRLHSCAQSDRGQYGRYVSTTDLICPPQLQSNSMLTIHWTMDKALSVQMENPDILTADHGNISWEKKEGVSMPVKGLKLLEDGTKQLSVVNTKKILAAGVK